MKSGPISYIIGIDEAGRGPLAGPVAVGAVIIPTALNKKFKKLLIDIRDSKKLTEKSREAWFKKLKIWQQENLLNFHVSLVKSTTIDNKGISKAIKRAITFCLKKIEADPKNSHVLLDGSLYAPKDFLFQETIIGGDDLEPIISLASVAAKVKRDKHMMRLAKKFPEYKFEIHKGYGTKIHRDAIKKHGLSPYHRLSFCKNFITISKS